MNEGELIPPEQIPKYLAPLLGVGNIEFWRLLVNNLPSERFAVGDVLPVERTQPHSGCYVLATVVQSGVSKSIFRLYLHPHLWIYARKGTLEQAERVDDGTTTLRGVILPPIRPLE